MSELRRRSFLAGVGAGTGVLLGSQSSYGAADGQNTAIDARSDARANVAKPADPPIIRTITRDEAGNDVVTEKTPLDLKSLEPTDGTPPKAVVFFIQGDGFDDNGETDVTVLMNGTKTGTTLLHKTMKFRAALHTVKNQTSIRVVVRKIITTDTKQAIPPRAGGDSALTITTINPDGQGNSFPLVNVVYS